MTSSSIAVRKCTQCRRTARIFIRMFSSRPQRFLYLHRIIKCSRQRQYEYTRTHWHTLLGSHKQDTARITKASPITLVRSYTSHSFSEIVGSAKSKDSFSAHANLAKSSDIVDDPPTDDFHDSDAIISTFDLFSIGIGPSSRHAPS